MTEPPKPTSKELRALRDAFEANARKTVAEFNQRILEADRTEVQREKEEFLGRFVPQVSNTAALAGHDIVFLIGQFKAKASDGSMPSLLNTIAGAALDAAFQINTVLKDVAGVTVKASLWGSTGTTGVYTGKYEAVTNALDRTDIMADRQFVPVAKEILAVSTPDKLTDRHTHYVIITDGVITDNVAHAKDIMNVVQQFNPKATFDVIVKGPETINIDLASSVAKEIQNSLPGAEVKVTVTKAKEPFEEILPNAGFTKISAPADVAGAILNALKTRLAALVPAPAPKTEAAPKP